MGLLPSGTLSVVARSSQAPTADDLLGRPHIPAIAHGLLQAGATVRGFIDSPTAPLKGRDRLLAKWDRGLDVEASGGFSLRALDAVSGKFHVHLSPPIGAGPMKYSVHVALAAEGDETNAVVQTDPHAPDAPVGFYNLSQATGALSDVRRILEAVVESPDTLDVNRLRAEAIVDRVGQTQGYLGRLSEAMSTRPRLNQLAEAARLAHASKAEGDKSDVQLSYVVADLNAYLDSGADGLAPDLIAQAKEDLQTISADRKKWHGWRASTGLFKFYVAT